MTAARTRSRKKTSQPCGGRDESRAATSKASGGDDEARWQAVVARTRAADDLFVFAVATTGIYCRPSCPARRPHRQNVAFYDNASEARAAGYRACLRCHPDQTTGTDAESRARAAVIAACRMIEHAEQVPPLAELARVSGLSASHLHRTFKATLGLTPKEYAAGIRAERLRAAMPEASSITDALHAAGFGASSRFYAAAGDILGMAPSTHRKGGKGETIAFVLATSSLGLVLIAQTARGLCAVLLGVDGETLRAELAARFPKADIRHGDADLRRQAAAVVALIEAPEREAPELPLDLEGTVFQLRVWQALRCIPAGQTASYGALARQIGAPSATRAVARACGANPLAVLVPCHRVVGADGALTGYRWGVERKRVLLERERAVRGQVTRTQVAPHCKSAPATRMDARSTKCDETPHHERNAKKRRKP